MLDIETRASLIETLFSVYYSVLLILINKFVTLPRYFIIGRPPSFHMQRTNHCMSDANTASL